LRLELVAFDAQVVLAGDVFSLGAIAQLEEVREALEPLVDAAPASLAGSTCAPDRRSWRSLRPRRRLGILTTTVVLTILALMMTKPF
jgi:hypothetical protein